MLVSLHILYQYLVLYHAQSMAHTRNQPKQISGKVTRVQYGPANQQHLLLSKAGPLLGDTQILSTI